MAKYRIDLSGQPQTAQNDLLSRLELLGFGDVPTTVPADGKIEIEVQEPAPIADIGSLIAITGRMGLALPVKV